MRVDASDLYQPANRSLEPLLFSKKNLEMIKIHRIKGKIYEIKVKRFKDEVSIYTAVSVDRRSSFISLS